MITKYIKGDIVDLFERGYNIAHGCNCFQTMGGLAGQLAKACPDILEADKAVGFKGDMAKLGHYTKATRVHGMDDREVHCFNLYTQYEPGRNLSYPALVSCLEALNTWAKNQLCMQKVYMPRIGCGIAGGEWEKVCVLINMFTPNLDIIIVDWEG